MTTPAPKDPLGPRPWEHAGRPHSIEGRTGIDVYDGIGRWVLKVIGDDRKKCLGRTLALLALVNGSGKE